MKSSLDTPLETCAILCAAVRRTFQFIWLIALGAFILTFANASILDAAPTESAAAIAAGRMHTCVLTTAGGVMCWGRNNHGQLGDGTTTNRDVPAYVSGLSSGVTTIAVGQFHSCAVVGGGVKCWGFNSYGELGDGTSASRHTPVDVLVNPGGTPLTGIMAIDAGAYHTCALTSGGGVKCWGLGTSGQLGDGSNANRYNPVDVSGLGSGGSALSVENYHSCAVANGSAKCWGYNVYGQLGDGTTAAASTPVNVHGLTSNVTAISAGYDHTCAVVNGGAKCWGWNIFGQLGDGTKTDRLTPTAVSGLTSGLAAISAGYYHTCAPISGGAKCWGAGIALGNGNQESLTPSDVLAEGGGTLSGISAVSAGEAHACAVMTNGGAKCWGSNYYGQIGDGGPFSVRYFPVDVLGFGAPACTTAPDKPTLLAPKYNGSTSKTRPTLKWNTATCADTYTVTVKDAATGKNADKATGLTALQHKTKTLTRGKIYKWFVQACNAIGCTKSATWRFTVQ